MSDEGVVQILTFLNDFRAEMRELKSEVKELKERVVKLEAEVAQLKQDIKRIEIKQEKDKEEIIQEYKMSQEVIGKIITEQNQKIKVLEKALNIS